LPGFRHSGFTIEGMLEGYRGMFQARSSPPESRRRYLRSMVPFLVVATALLLVVATALWLLFMAV
jgi:hypothetical protein